MFRTLVWGMTDWYSIGIMIVVADTVAFSTLTLPTKQNIKFQHEQEFSHHWRCSGYWESS